MPDFNGIVEGVNSLWAGFWAWSTWLTVLAVWLGITIAILVASTLMRSTNALTTPTVSGPLYQPPAPDDDDDDDDDLGDGDTNPLFPYLT